MEKQTKKDRPKPPKLTAAEKKALVAQQQAHVKALAEERKKGNEEGYSKGTKEGEEKGYSKAKKEWYSRGKEEGFENGKAIGLKEGIKKGKKIAYPIAYKEGAHDKFKAVIDTVEQKLAEDGGFKDRETWSKEGKIPAWWIAVFITHIDISRLKDIELSSAPAPPEMGKP